MDIITYALCKKIAASATSGIKDMRVDGQDLIIVKEDDSELVVHFPEPEFNLNWLPFVE